MRADSRHPGRHREDPHVLCPQEAGRTGSAGGIGASSRFWGGLRRLWRNPPGPPLPFNASKPVWRSGHAQENFLERLITSSVGGLNSQEHVPLLDCQAFKAPLSPRRGFTFGADRAAAGWRNQLLKSDFDTLVGLEARA